MIILKILFDEFSFLSVLARVKRLFRCVELWSVCHILYFYRAYYYFRGKAQQPSVISYDTSSKDPLMLR